MNGDDDKNDGLSPSHPKSIMKNSLSSRELANCLLVVGKKYEKKQFNVIKEILQLHSPVLKNRLDNSSLLFRTLDQEELRIVRNYRYYAEKKIPIFFWQDLDPNAFQILLHYIYTWEWTPSLKDEDFPQMLSLWSMAQELEVSHLEEQINEKLCQILTSALQNKDADSDTFPHGLTPKNIFTIFQTSNSLRVKEKALDLILKYPLTCFGNRKDYEQLEEDELNHIFSCKNIQLANDYWLFYVAHKWAEAKCGPQCMGEHKIAWSRYTSSDEFIGTAERSQKLKELLQRLFQTIKFTGIAKGWY